MMNGVNSTMAKREKHYIASEVAALCNCSVQDVYNALKDGILKGYKCRTGKWLIPIVQEEAFQELAENKEPVTKVRIDEPEKPTRSFIKYIADEQHYTEVFTRMNKVRRTLRLTSADLKNFNVYIEGKSEPMKFCDFLLSLLNRGVKVQIICMKPFYFYNYCQENLPELLDNNNLEIRQCDHIHMKVFIFDDECAYIGSANLTGAAIGRRSSNKRNHEAGILVQNCQVFEDAFNHFNRVWDDPEVLKASWKRFKKQASEYRKKYQE